MNPMIIRAADLKENDYGHIKLSNIINDEDYGKFSLALSKQIDDNIKLGADSESDTAYYVLEGSGKYIIEGREFTLDKGDTIFLPSGTKYKSLKGLTLLIVSSPRFDRAKRKYFE